MRVRYGVLALSMLGVMAFPVAAESANGCFGDGRAALDTVTGNLRCERTATGDGSGGGDGSYCDYEVAVPDDTQDRVALQGSRYYEVPTGNAADSSDQGLVNIVVNGLADSERRFSGTGRWVNRECYGPDPLNEYLGREGPIPEAGPRTFAEIIDAAEAKLQVTRPPEALHPGKQSNTPSLLQLPTFFWVESDYWGDTQSAQDRYGNVVVTVNATPTSFFLTFDGAPTEECRVNTIWQPSLSDNDPAACTHTFTEVPFEDEVFDAVLTVVHETSWSSNVAGWTTPQTLDPVGVESDVFGHSIAELVGLRGN